MPELYFISNCLELQGMQNDLAGCYQLTNDIDCSDTRNWDGGAGFAPVGSSANPFTGAFNGDDYKIYDLYIYRPSADYVGLFGCTERPFEIYRAGIEQASVVGRNSVGGLVGRNYGEITNSHFTGNVTGDRIVGGLVGYLGSGSVLNSYSIGNVKGNDEVGGLIGQQMGFYSYTTFTSGSYSTASVIGREGVGGLVGYNSGSVFNSYSTGNVIGEECVGGLVGKDHWSEFISNSYSTGNVIGEKYVGGLVGAYNGNLILNSYSVGSVTGNDRVGGLVGAGGFSGVMVNVVITSYYDKDTSGQSIGRGIGLPTALMKQRATFLSWDFTNIWTINEGIDYPRLKWEEELFSESIIVPLPECFLLTPTPIEPMQEHLIPIPSRTTPTASHITSIVPYITLTVPVVTPTAQFVTPTAPFVTSTVQYVTPTAPIVTPTLPEITPTAFLPTPTAQQPIPTVPFVINDDIQESTNNHLAAIIGSTIGGFIGGICIAALAYITYRVCAKASVTREFCDTAMSVVAAKKGGEGPLDNTEDSSVELQEASLAI